MAHNCNLSISISGILDPEESQENNGKMDTHNIYAHIYIQRAYKCPKGLVLWLIYLCIFRDGSSNFTHTADAQEVVVNINSVGLKCLPVKF